MSIVSLKVSPIFRSAFAWSNASCSRCCSGWPTLSRRRAEPTQQRENRKGHNSENGDFAQRVETPEIDEDDVDDVGPATVRVGALDEETRYAPGQRARHDRKNEESHARPRGDRDRKIGAASPKGRKWDAPFGPDFRTPPRATI